MSKMITRALLIQHDACTSQLRLFHKKYPQGIVPTEEECEKVAELLAFSWAAEHLLSDVGLEQFERLERVAKADWNDVVRPAEAAFERARAPAWDLYAAEGPVIGWPDAWTRYSQAVDPAYDALNKVHGPADEAYSRAIARAFGAIWCQENP